MKTKSIETDALFCGGFQSPKFVRRRKRVLKYLVFKFFHNGPRQVEMVWTSVDPVDLNLLDAGPTEEVSIQTEES